LLNLNHRLLKIQKLRKIHQAYTLL